MDATRIVVAAALVFALIDGAAAAGPADAPPGAFSCSGCHAATRAADTTVPRLNGRNPADIVTAMEAFKSGQLPSTVMGRIAKGFSDDEVKAIAAWYGAQKD
jgi:cytochrome subunit of sulfide dehydrogenase